MVKTPLGYSACQCTTNNREFADVSSSEIPFPTYYEAGNNHQPAGSKVSIPALNPFAYILDCSWQMFLFNYPLLLQPFKIQILTTEDFCHLQAFWI